ncbi:MAG: hypothetical protein QOJ02_679 [Acidobacteriota bacterium]|jgi:hypothetical protein|nr:hypothetical protein [Acidobacteriota bacterium]
MKKYLAPLLIFTACLLTACDQDCPMTGSPNTTYLYTYVDNGVAHSGGFTTNANGNAEISVPDNIDCKGITFSEDKAPVISPEQGPVA